MPTRYSWANDIAWADDGVDIHVMLLPDGPVFSLTDADDVVDHMWGEFSVADIVTRAQGTCQSDVMVFESGVAEFIDGLCSAGLLVVRSLR